jgi:hypothetical protein
MTWDHFQVESFASVEDAMTAMRRAEQRANARVTPEQTAIGYGDHWCSAFEDFLIFGRVSTLEELDTRSAELTDDPEEVQAEHDMIVSAHARGYRFGWAYSVAEPDGELGSTHISRMTSITERQFDRAKGHAWRYRQMMDCPDCHYWIRQTVLALVG